MFRFIKYGVKMTAYAGVSEKSFSDEQIWQLAAFLRIAPGISAGSISRHRTGVAGDGSIENRGLSG